MTLAPRETSTLWVCVDCYFAHHGVLEDHQLEARREQEPDYEPLCELSDDELSAGMLWDEHECLPDTEWDDVPGDHECECERIDFVHGDRNPCDGCGSTLGGDREALTLWHDPAS